MRKAHSIGMLIGAALFVSTGLAAHGADKPAAKTLTYVKGATAKDIKSMNEPGVQAFFQDIVSSDNPTAPISCALFRLAKSEPLKFDYDYDDAKIILDGEITVTDGTSTVTATKGDVLLFPKGSTITFTTGSQGLAFACGQRPREAS